MTERATQPAPQSVPEPTPPEPAPTACQPSKAELEQDFDLPGMSWTSFGRRPAAPSGLSGVQRGYGGFFGLGRPEA